MRRVALACLANAALVLGCGGGSEGGASCGKVQPCGGDVVGRWTVVDECETDAGRAEFPSIFATMAAASFCPAQTLRAFDPSGSGSFLFNADMTYSGSIVWAANIDINVPASCTSGLDCAGFGANIQAQIAAGIYQPNVTAFSCSGASNCVCREVLSIPQSEMGTYSTSGSVLTFVATTGDVSDFSYCIEGTTAHFLTLSTGTTIGSDLIATKE